MRRKKLKVTYSRVPYRAYYIWPLRLVHRRRLGGNPGARPRIILETPLLPSASTTFWPLPIFWCTPHFDKSTPLDRRHQNDENQTFYKYKAMFSLRER